MYMLHIHEPAVTIVAAVMGYNMVVVVVVSPLNVADTADCNLLLEARCPCLSRLIRRSCTVKHIHQPGVTTGRAFTKVSATLRHHGFSRKPEELRHVIEQYGRLSRLVMYMLRIHEPAVP